LPWGIQIIEGFDYLKERTPVNDGYLNFLKWAESSGKNYIDWYKDDVKNRNSEKIYLKKK
jgi:LruC domain-containing protein